MLSLSRSASGGALSLTDEHGTKPSASAAQKQTVLQDRAAAVQRTRASLLANPFDHVALLTAAQILLVSGRFEDAARMHSRALSFMPGEIGLDEYSDLFWVTMLAGDPTAALGLIDQFCRAHPTVCDSEKNATLETNDDRAAALLLRGHDGDAQKAWLCLNEMSSASGCLKAMSIYGMANAYGDNPDPDGMVPILMGIFRGCLKNLGDDELALVYAYCCDAPKALACLERVLTERSRDTLAFAEALHGLVLSPFIRRSACFPEIEADPVWQSLLALEGVYPELAAIPFDISMVEEMTDTQILQSGGRPLWCGEDTTRTFA